MKKFLKDNSSILLVVAGSLGTISTAYLAARAGYQSAQNEDVDPQEDWKGYARRTWRLYIPAAGSAAVTILCISGVKHVDGKRTLAAQTTLAVTQQAYESYREAVVEELGDRKDKLLLAKVAEKDVHRNPPHSIVAGSGTVLCREGFTGRYFNSDMQALSNAVNALNAKLLKADYATLDDFYYLIELEGTQISGTTGWESDRLLELEFSSVLHEGVPVLSFEYSYVKSL